jgi:hypothetical protein
VSNVVTESLVHAESSFGFLLDSGFELTTRQLLGDPAMFKSGWELRYESPTVSVRVLYADWQLEVRFECRDALAEYFALDQDAFDRRSGYHGNMFPPDGRLTGVIDRVSADIRTNYGAILTGDRLAWERAVRILSALRVKRGLP